MNPAGVWPTYWGEELMRASGASYSICYIIFLGTEIIGVPIFTCLVSTDLTLARSAGVWVRQWDEKQWRASDASYPRQ